VSNNFNFDFIAINQKILNLEKFYTPRVTEDCSILRRIGYNKAYYSDTFWQSDPATTPDTWVNINQLINNYTHINS
jgi:hypothetical protein